ncbi:MAG: CDP-alcohol phosphatidyltransferase family protein, partial [Pseudomonadota bacterium]
MFYQIINTCDVELWEVSQKDRIANVLAKVGDFEYVRDLAKIPASQKILLLDSRYLYEVNVISKLVGLDQAVLLSSCNKEAIGIWAERSKVEAIRPWLQDYSNSQTKFSVQEFTAEKLTGTFDPRLLKYDLSHAVKITKESKVRLENYLYDKSYKGITDLVTKWLWPLPARGVVRICAANKIKPNLVTGFGWVLTIIAGISFYFGEFVLGLIAAWLMTFLDTVDGKLARVTLQSSKVGHA